MPILIILILLMVAFFAIGDFFARRVIFPRVFAVDETYRRSKDSGLFEGFDDWQKETLTLRSPDGYDLYTEYYPLAGANRTIVLTHGITWSAYGMVKYAQIFRRRGWNVLLYDLRNHGRSGGSNTTFGVREKFDLKVVVDYAFARLGAGGIVGTYGESLGAATTLQHTAIDDRIAFAVSDCAFSDLRSLLAYRVMVEYHLPPGLLLYLAELFTRLRAGLRFGEASPIQAIEAVSTPILFIHGAEDRYIPPRMSEEMAHVKRAGASYLWLAPNADHAESLYKNPAAYEQRVNAFLDEIRV